MALIPAGVKAIPAGIKAMRKESLDVDKDELPKCQYTVPLFLLASRLQGRVKQISNSDHTWWFSGKRK